MSSYTLPFSESSSRTIPISARYSSSTFRERLGTLSRKVEDMDTDSGEDNAQSSRPTRQAASGRNHYGPAQKRKNEQDDGPRKRVTDTLAQSTIIENTRGQDIFFENGRTNDSSESNDDGNSTDGDNYQETSTSAAPGLVLGHDFLKRRDKHLEHWRAWCQRKRYLDDTVTAEKYGTYINESLSPKSHHDGNNPHLEILPIRVDSSDNEEGEIPAWEDVVCHISSIRSLYLGQCESNGVCPDIDGTMAQPETVAVISKFRSMYVGVALGMAKTEVAAAVINPREQGVGAEAFRDFHHSDSTVATETPLKPCYLVDDSATEPYKLLANTRLPGENMMMRDAIIPPLELQRQIFPFIEKLFPDNDDWKFWIDNIMMNRPDPVFSSQAFLRFAHQLQEAMQSRSGCAQAAESNGDPIKTHLTRQDIPLEEDVVFPITTVHNHLSSSAQLPTPTEDSEVDTTLLNTIPPEPAIQTQQLTSNQQSSKQQGLPRELIAIWPTKDDDPDILEIKMSLTSMFRYMETESKAVGRFASATFSSLEQLQGQVAVVENTVQVLLEKEMAAESKSVERPVPESVLDHPPPQQDFGHLEQWLQQQNEIRPWRKDFQQGTVTQHHEERLSRSAGSTGETRLSGDSETRRGDLLNMNTLRENMSRTKALNQDVKRRISNLEAELLAVGQSLRAVVGVGATEERSEAELQARDEDEEEGEEEVEERDEPTDEEEDENQDEEWEQEAPGGTRTGTRTGSSKAATRKENRKRKALKSFYPEDLVVLAGQIAALYPQLSEDKVRTMHASVTRPQIPLASPTTLKDIWVEHFSVNGSQPSFWSLETYVEAWRSGFSSKQRPLVARKKVVIAAILREVGQTKGSSLKAREEKALALLEATMLRMKGIYNFCSRYNGKGVLRK
ncbi:hypothetical protein BGZ95_008639 [Linnemannia exigua]|uniref:Uncharacterized protein n=1 Tax=Linnemannia exigua TaxID=604196 RepID=A0AAD4DDU3_9FUNG|nr:hypothetical protein BGZ95_008639 [Linnemannia exigua]